MKPEQLREGVDRFKTPLYIFDKDKMTDTVDAFRRVFKDKIDLCFAMKANPFLTRQMAHVTDRVEVCSMGEFEICRILGIEASKVIISGVMKKREDIFRILDHYEGKCLCTIESSQHRVYLEEWCRERGQTVSVVIRLSSGNQFGIDEEALRREIGSIRNHQPLRLQGIHFFSGTQKRNVKKIQKELEKLDVLLVQLEQELQMKFAELEYGPGLLVPYFEDQTDTWQQDMEEMYRAVERMQWKGKITFEMGRALAARCGYYLTTVEDVKKTEGKNYCIVDGGVHQINYDGQIRGMYRPHLTILPADDASREIEEWTVCGSLCTVNDVLLQSMPLAGIAKGSILAFERTGAYAMTEGMSLFLSHELPGIVLYSEKEGFTVMREQMQTYLWNTEGNGL